MQRFKKKLFRKDQYITMFGSTPNTNLYLITKGTAKKQVFGKVYDVKQGDFINLVSALSKRAQICTVKANSEVEALVIPIENIDIILKYSNLIVQIFKQLGFYTKEIFSDYLPANGLKEELSDEEHQKCLLSLGKYLLEQHLYERSKYVFNKLNEYYPIYGSNKEVNEYLTEINNNLEKQENDSFGNKRLYNVGETIFTQFEINSKAFFINKGEIKLYLYTGKNEYYVETFKEKSLVEVSSFQSKFKALSCIVSQNETEIVFIENNTFEKFIEKQNKEILLRIMKQFSKKIWKGSMIIEHVRHSEDEKNNHSKIYDILYTLYEAENINFQEESEQEFNFKISIRDLFKSTPRDPNFHLEDLITIITKSSFLYINEKEEIVCKNLQLLKTNSYKTRQRKERNRYIKI